MRFLKLFEPANIGTMELRNRIVMAPHGSVERAYLGFVPEREIHYYAERARGGAGLLITVNICVDSPLGKVSQGMMCIDNDKYITGMAELAEAVHLWGAKIAMQLSHAGRDTNLAATEGRQPVSASATTYVRPGWAVTSRELTLSEILEVEDRFAEAARRAKVAGFDAVELHGAMGHCLIAQFLSPYTNKRIDMYGGSLDNRMRFALDIIRQIRHKVGKGLPIIFRMSGDEYVPGGISLEESKLIAQKLEREGVDALHVVAGHIDALHHTIPPMGTTPEGSFLMFAEALKQVVNIPVITAGRIKDPVVAERILQEGRADFVAMARALIADPEWPNKARTGKLDEIRTCIGCNWGCVGAAAVFAGRNMKCDINAAVGKEKEYRITRAERPRRVVVVGGGPAGMETARVAALRGHKVTLLERRRQLGGQLLLAAASPYKTEIGYLTRYLARQMTILGVDVRMEHEATREAIEAMDPEVVIIATGATPTPSTIPGAERPNVYQAWDVLEGTVDVKGKTVAVAGGGMVGCEAAEVLASRGMKVSIIDRLPDVGIDMEPLTKTYAMERFARDGTQLVTQTSVEEVTDHGVILMDKEWRRRHVEVDGVVLALGAVPNNALQDELREATAEVYMIGDAVKPRRISDAISEGSFIARQI